MNLSDAPSDPHFSYRPETGEDPFKSFLSVPIVRGGQVFGVLTVQNRARRTYTEEEEEALQTTAMVLAEMIASGELSKIAKPGAVLATNTTYLNVDQIAQMTSRVPDVLGMHFFSPANVMKLLEIVRGKDTAPEVLATAMAVGR